MFRIMLHGDNVMVFNVSWNLHLRMGLDWIGRGARGSLPLNGRINSMLQDVN